MNDKPTSVRPASVLVVDDNRANLRLLAGVLTQQGYTVRAVPDGRMVLASVQAKLPDLILLDINMPDMDGYQVCEQLKADEHTRDVPVIFISVGTEAFDKVRAFSVGGVDYITKPFQVEEVLVRVKTHLALRATQKQLEDTNAQLTHAIAEHKRTEQVLQESEERFRKVFEQGPVGMGILDLDEHFISANPVLCHMVGYTEEELMALTFNDITHPEDRDASQQLARLLANGEAPHIRTEKRYVTKDGRISWISLTATFVHDDRGNPLYKLTMIEDITERKQAEEALKESAETLRLIFENAFDGISICEERAGRKRRLLDCNERYVEMSGRSKKELLEIQNPSLVQRNLGPVQSEEENLRIRRDGLSYQGLFSWIRPDGKENIIEYSAAPIQIGNRPLTVGVDRDITDRVQAEQALRVSEEKFSKSFHSSPAMMSISTLEGGRYMNVNEGFSRLTGYSREEAVGRTSLELNIFAHPGDRARMARMLEERGSIRNVEADIRIKSGAVRAGSFSAEVIEIEGQPCLLAVVDDITERKRAEGEREQLLAQIHEQAQRMQQIMDTVPEGVLLLDPDGRIMRANPEGERHLALLSDARVGDALTRLGDCPLAELLTSPPQGLWRDVPTDGCSFQVIARPVSEAAETSAIPGGWVVVVRDVTQQREYERRIQQHERLAAVGQLAAGIAHDFNNIMATIVLYAQMSARAEDVPDQIRQRMATINQQAKHATRLIQQILDFSRRAVLERRPLDLLPLLKEQVKLLERTLPENIEIKLTCGPVLSETEGQDEYIINADPTRIQQAITNLAVNARDAMLEGGELRLGLERLRIADPRAVPLPEMQAGEWIQVTVSDTGTGIPPDVLPHIFEPFFTTKAPLGSGLGLAQVYGIVAQHQGHIGVESRVGQGTTFTMYLPSLPAHSSEPSAAAAREELPALPKGQGEIILVVEDDAATRKALAESLDMLGYRTLEAANGREALAAIEQRGDEIALALSDVVMPGMGGIALLHALRERELTTHVVLLTGHPLEKELEDLRAQGGAALLADWLLKPPNLEALGEAIARALGKSR